MLTKALISSWPSYTYSIDLKVQAANGLFQKKTKRGFEDMEFPRVGIEERKCGNSSGQLKKKRNFQQCSRGKTHGISMGLRF